MAAMACSPSAHACGFRSPLRSLRADSCEWAGSTEVLADAQAQLVQWRKDLISAASFEAQQGLRELRHERDQLKDLQSDLTGVQSLVQVASQLRAGGERLADTLSSCSQAGSSRAQTVAALHEDMQRSCDRSKEALREEKQRATQQKVLSDAQHAEALKLLSTYQDRLGLHIRREAPQTVRIAFCLIDEKDAEKEFCFTLGLATSDKGSSESYGVLECAPPVPELKKLVEDLNRNACSPAALPRFVCGMRKAFLRLARES